MLYRPNSETARECEEYVREFEHRTSKNIEVVNIDTPDGVSLMRLYDIVQHPTLIALANDGRLQQMWAGKPLPLINEVAAYVK